MSQETHTFDGAIQMSKSWSKIRFTESEAHLLINNCHAALASPGEHPDLVLPWNTFHSVIEPEIDQRLKYTNWENTEGRALVLLAEACINIGNGIQHYLPAHISFWFTHEDKETLWNWHLLKQGMYLHPLDPFCLLRSSSLLYTGGAHAIVECQGRAAKYPCEFAGGMFAYFSRSDEGSIAGADGIMAEALKRIARVARGKIPSNMLQRDEGKTVPWTLPGKLNWLDVQVAESVLKDSSEDTAEGVIARALDGKLSPVKAVLRDVIDQNKSNQANFERDISPVSELAKLSAQETEEIKFTIEEYPVNPIIEEENATKKEIEILLRDLDRFSVAHPAHGKALRNWLDGIKQDDQARAEGVTTRAIKKRLKNARQEFKNWLEKQNRPR